MAAIVTGKNVCANFGADLVLDHIDFALEPGQIACLLGPSGCGKTTLLRAIAGLHSLYAGEIWLRGGLASSNKRDTTPEARRLGFVFQDLALFPHFTSAENIALGLGKLTPPARKIRVDELLRQFELVPFKDRYPHELSGGQQQRIAIARALAPKHDLVLLDEPFSSLDAKLRVSLSRDLRKQLKAQGTAAIMVSHDQEEGLVCADVIGVMEKGRLVQWGTPFEVYCQPQTAFVADFVGEGSFLPVHADGAHLQTPLGPIAAFAEPGQQRILVRPEDLHIDPQSAVRAQIIHSEFRGSYVVYRLQLGDAQLLLSAAHATPIADGTAIGVRFAPTHVNLFS